MAGSSYNGVAHAFDSMFSYSAGNGRITLRASIPSQHISFGSLCGTFNASRQEEHVSLVSGLLVRKNLHIARLLCSYFLTFLSLHCMLPLSTLLPYPLAYAGHWYARKRFVAPAGCERLPLLLAACIRVLVDDATPAATSYLLQYVV